MTQLNNNIITPEKWAKMLRTQFQKSAEETVETLKDDFQGISAERILELVIDKEVSPVLTFDHLSPILTEIDTNDINVTVVVNALKESAISANDLGKILALIFSISTIEDLENAIAVHELPTETLLVLLRDTYHKTWAQEILGYFKQRNIRIETIGTAIQHVYPDTTNKEVADLLLDNGYSLEESAKAIKALFGSEDFLSMFNCFLHRPDLDVVALAKSGKTVFGVGDPLLCVKSMMDFDLTNEQIEKVISEVYGITHPASFEDALNEIYRIVYGDHPLGKPKNAVYYFRGNDGEIDVRWDGVDGAVSYDYEVHNRMVLEQPPQIIDYHGYDHLGYTPMPQPVMMNTLITSGSSPINKVSIPLQFGDYVFRYRANGNKAKGEWTEYEFKSFMGIMLIPPSGVTAIIKPHAMVVYWNAISMAAHYDISISDSRNNELVPTILGVKDAYYEIPPMLLEDIPADEDIYVKVRANDKENQGYWERRGIRAIYEANNFQLRAELTYHDLIINWNGGDETFEIAIIDDAYGPMIPTITDAMGGHHTIPSDKLRHLGPDCGMMVAIRPKGGMWSKGVYAVYERFPGSFQTVYGFAFYDLQPPEKEMQAVGTTVEEVLAPEEIPELNIELMNGWVNYEQGYNPASVDEVGDTVFVTGVLKMNESGHFATLATVYRPSQRLVFNLNCADEDDYCRIDLLPNGELHLMEGGIKDSWLSLDGIIYNKGTGTSLSCSSPWQLVEDYSPLQLFHKNDTYYLSGLLGGGVSGDLLKLPPEARPTKRLSYSINNDNSGARIDIYNTGVVKLRSSSTRVQDISLEGIAFHPKEGQELSLLNNWAHSKYGAPIANVTIKNGVCVLAGRIKNGKDKVIAILPEDCHPKERMIFNIVTNKKPIGVEILPDGIVQIIYNNDIPKWLSLDGICFVV